MEFYLMPNFNFSWYHVVSMDFPYNPTLFLLNEMRGCQMSSKLFYTVIDHIIIYI
jgi:hypothetical protein